MTLVELLVVIAILGILAALLLTGISRAKGKAWQAACLNNLSEINKVVRMYADDSRDTAPETEVFLGPDIWSFYTKRMKEYMGKRAGADRLFKCPADRFYYENPEPNDVWVRISQPMCAQSKYFFSSYAFNAGNSANKVKITDSQPQFGGVAGRKLSSVREPSKTVLVAEFSAFSPFSWHKPGPTHHYNNSLNMVSFVDGHVKLTRMYRDDDHLSSFHSEAWQYEPPPGYEYKWSGD